MPVGKLNLYDLGAHGVDLTKSIVHAEDGTLRQAQNAVSDSRGEQGGLAKRDGLLAINSVSAGGTIQGAINVPLPATRNVLVGRPGNNWVISTDDFVATPSTTASLTAIPTYTYLTSIAGPFGGGTGLAYYGRVAYNGTFMIYPANGYTQWTMGSSAANDAPSLRLWNGSTDREICRVPVNPNVVVVSAIEQANCLGVYDMIMDGTKVYFTTYDYIDGSAHYGRVMCIDTATAELSQIGEAFGAGTGDLNGGMPWTLVSAQGYLWVGTGTGSSTSGLATARVYRIRPGIDSNWVLDKAFTNHETVISLRSYRGKMYAGLMDRTVGNVGNLYQRASDGTWTSVATTTAAPSGGYSRCGALTVFNDKLYFSKETWNGATSTCTLNSYDETTFTAVHTFSLPVSPGDRPLMVYQGFVTGGKLFFVAGMDQGTGPQQGRVAYSSTGAAASFTEQATSNPMSAITAPVGVVVT